MSLRPEDRERYPFELHSIDWYNYLADTHVPGIMKFVLRKPAAKDSTAAHA